MKPDQGAASQPISLIWTPLRASIAVALGSFLSVLFTLGDPGITCDEPLDVRPGRTYVESLLREGSGFFSERTVDRVFRDNSEHPPLGRWLLGIASILGEPFARPFLGGVDPFSVHSGRLAPAIAFSILVGLITHASSVRFGLASGLAAGFALCLSPRVWSHAHLGALDTFLALFWTASILSVEKALASKRPIAGMAWAGAVWGLAVLTKIPAWILPPLVLIRTVWVLGVRRGPIAFAIWLFTGVVLYFAGWPWLWWHTRERLNAYFSTGFERIPIKVMYFGSVYLDKHVPWHYPWFYFAIAVPVGFQLLGVLGAWLSSREKKDRGFFLFLAASVLVVLLLLSIRHSVYDGERLFLFVFPSWAMLIGRGFGSMWYKATGRIWLRTLLAFAFVCQAYGMVATHPFGLGYYNALVGGQRGAERLGLELTYWGDAIDKTLLQELAKDAKPGEIAALAPSLHHIQGPAFTTERLAAKSISVSNQEKATSANWVLIYRREAYWPAGLREWIGSRPPILLRKCQGVWVSGLWRGPIELPGAAAIGSR